jgi:hypothetical protein
MKTSTLPSFGVKEMEKIPFVKVERY